MSKKPESLFKHLALAFAIALLFYVAAYTWDRHLRLKNGPWAVTFVSDGKSAPSLVINDPKLGITDVKITFIGESIGATNATVIFDAPAKTVPFGKLIFDDLMYQPGTVTLDMFGHEVELIPRTLTVDKKHVPWKSGMVIELKPEEKVPVKPEAKK